MYPNDLLTRQMADFADNMRRLFDDLDAPERVLWPLVDIRADGDDVVLCAEVPGVPRESLEIEVDGPHLTLRGEKPAPAEVEGARPVHRERWFGRFERTFELGFDVARDQITAELRDGVLRVRLPKAEEAKPRRIEVQA